MVPYKPSSYGGIPIYKTPMAGTVAGRQLPPVSCRTQSGSGSARTHDSSEPQSRAPGNGEAAALGPRSHMKSPRPVAENSFNQSLSVDQLHLKDSKIQRCFKDSTIFNHIQPYSTIFNHIQPYSTIPADMHNPMPTSSNIFQLASTCVAHL